MPHGSVTRSPAWTGANAECGSTRAAPSGRTCVHRWASRTHLEDGRTVEPIVIALPAKLSPSTGLSACVVCGTEFLRRGRQLYCRPACGKRAWRSRHPQSWRQLVGERSRSCPRCHEAFAARNLRRMFCSKRCRNAVVRQHWREDPIRARARARAWFREHADLVRQRALKWSREHPVEKAQHRHARRARARGALGKWTASEWRTLRPALGDRCTYCGSTTTLTIDHRVPLVRGGSNTLDNLTLACRPCNSRKGTRTDVEFIELSIAAEGQKSAG